ncbi:unnamed protein product, partial [marine sediment metagenome]
TWANYLMGVVDEIQKAGYILQGANLIFRSNIPRKAGLSSSAALEVVTALAIAELNSLKIEPVKIIKRRKMFVSINMDLISIRSRKRDKCGKRIITNNNSPTIFCFFF